MLTFTLMLSLAAGPRTGGVYLQAQVVAKVLEGRPGEFDLERAMAFGPKKVTVGFDMEEETKQWRWSKKSGLEVRDGPDDEWSEVQWTETAKGVRSSLRRDDEVYVFVPKTLAQLRALRQQTQDKELLASLRGTWLNGARVLEIATPSTLDGRPIELKSVGCNYQCANKEQRCVELGRPPTSTMLLVRDRTLVEVHIEGLCDTQTTGVELVEGGHVFQRK